MNWNEKVGEWDSLWEDIRTRFDEDKITSQQAELQQQMAQPGFWDDATTASEISQTVAQNQKRLDEFREIGQRLTDFREWIELYAPDAPELTTEGKMLSELLGRWETWILLGGKWDQCSAILTIKTGTGGDDAEDFSQMLLRMYLRFAERQDWRAEVTDESRSDVGLKSATIIVRGEASYGYLRGENGVHRLIRLSPFNAKSLRQTSFAKVEVVPEIPLKNEKAIPESELRWDVFRASGAGGQSVNTTDSAVRLTHIPTGIIVSCQNQRSQLQNRRTALTILHSRLEQIRAQEQASEQAKLRTDTGDNSFGSQIRTYTLQPYKLVKDHRTNCESSQPDQVLDGDLEDFVRAWLRQG